MSEFIDDIVKEVTDDVKSDIHITRFEDGIGVLLDFENPVYYEVFEDNIRNRVDEIRKTSKSFYNGFPNGQYIAIGYDEKRTINPGDFE